MPRNDNPHALRLANALRSHVGDAAAQAFADAHPLAKSADVSKKHRWACEICAALSAEFDADTTAAIRRDCRCNDGRTMAQQIAGCIRRAGSLAGGCALFTQENPYAFLEHVSDHELIFGYYACVCSCVKRAEGPVPLMWCECSCGYAEAMLRQVFGDGVQVELLNSVKAGGTRCEMRVYLP